MIQVSEVPDGWIAIAYVGADTIVAMAAEKREAMRRLRVHMTARAKLHSDRSAAILAALEGA